MGKLTFKAGIRPDAMAGPYQTQLSPGDESLFRSWLTSNAQVAPGIAAFNPDDRQSDYDMRGWWQAYSNPQHPQNQLTSMGTSSYDMQPHFNDYWKTPYHETFSQESQWAKPNKAPQWFDDGQGGWKLIDRKGKVIKHEPSQIGAVER
jgi:hypothetical protein